MKVRFIAVVSIVFAGVVLVVLLQRPKSPTHVDVDSPAGSVDSRIAERQEPVATSPQSTSSAESRSLSTTTLQRTRLIEVPEISNTPIAEEYESLVDRAWAGDAVASYTLWKKLGRCRGNIVSSEDVERRVIEMQQLFQVEDSNSGERYSVSDIQPHIDELRADSKFCEGLLPEQAEEGHMWLDRAAQQEFLPATLDFATFPPENLEPNTKAAAVYLDKRSERLDDAWEQGSVDALFWIGMDYYSGIVTDKNLAESYARLLAVQIASEGLGRYESIDVLVAQLENQISAADLNLYAEKSEELLRNKNCCSFIPQ